MYLSAPDPGSNPGFGDPTTMTHPNKLLTTWAAITLAPLVLNANSLDWPQWRGPDRTDVSMETGLLKSWPADGPKRLWLFENAGFVNAVYAKKFDDIAIVPTFILTPLTYLGGVFY
jgi:hypothetical protein